MIKPIFLKISIWFLALNLANGQWQQIPEFNMACNDAITKSNDEIIGVGNLGTVFIYNINDADLQRIEFDIDMDFYSISRLNDSIYFSCGRMSTNNQGFVAAINTNNKTLESVKYFQYPVNQIAFLSKDTGYFVCYGGIFQTLNSGDSWTQVWNIESIGARFGELVSIIIDDSENIYVSGIKYQSLPDSESQGIVLKSKDNGSSWELLLEEKKGSISNLEYNNGKIHCLDSDKLRYYSTTDQGETWDSKILQIDNPYLRFTDISFSEDNNIIITASLQFVPAGKSDYPSRNIIINSPDDGIHWYLQYIDYAIDPIVDSVIHTYVRVNDSISCAFGWNIALQTFNGGGSDNPLYLITTNRAIEENPISIYPNPVNSVIHVSGVLNANAILLYDQNGVLLNHRITYHEEIVTLPIFNLSPGLYLIRIIFPNSQVTKSIIKP